MRFLLVLFTLLTGVALAGLIAGLAKPGLMFWGPLKTRRQAVLIYGVASLALLTFAFLAGRASGLSFEKRSITTRTTVSNQTPSGGIPTIEKDKSDVLGPKTTSSPTGATAIPVGTRPDQLLPGEVPGYQIVARETIIAPSSGFSKAEEVSFVVLEPAPSSASYGTVKFAYIAIHRFAGPAVISSPSAGGRSIADYPESIKSRIPQENTPQGIRYSYSSSESAWISGSYLFETSVIPYPGKKLDDGAVNQLSSIVENAITQLQNGNTSAAGPVQGINPRSETNPPAQPLPANGTTAKFFKGDAIAPFKVLTRTGGPNYFVKVVDWDTKQLVLTVFVRSGQSAEVKLPLGTYEIRYAVGENWYGEDLLFGPETAFGKADKRFEFSREGDRVHGYTVELYSQPGGNLSTSNITRKDF